MSDNLKPFKKGFDPRRNISGKPAGTLNWSTIVKNLLEDEDLADKVIAKKPGWWSDLPNKNFANAIGVAMLSRAVSGDEKAAKWVRETGFGNKLDITSGEKPISILGGLTDIRSDDSPEEDPDDQEQAS